jgi:hypothetical protein
MANVVINLQFNGAGGVKPIVRAITKELSSIRGSIDLRLAQGTTRNLQSVNQQLDRLVNNINKVNQASTGLNIGNVLGKSSNLNSANKSLNQLAKGGKEAQGIIVGLGDAAALSGKRFAAFAVAATVVGGLIASIRSGVSSFIEFDRQLIRLQQVAEGSKEGVADIGEEVTRLATTLGVSSKSLLEASVILRQAGLSADDTKVALESLAKASLAPNFGDIKKTADGIVAIRSKIGL